MRNWILCFILVFSATRTTQAGVMAKADSTNGWGYGYDSLLKDLAIWRQNPNVKVDSVGSSVQGRGIWMVSITGPEDSLGLVGGSTRKHRIFVHARTHPAEVQVNYVANECITFLLQNTPESAKLRAGFIFNIIPMYNPDGVENGHDRLNAHLVDLESNWDKPDTEPEVLSLRHLFNRLMQGPIPVEVALNLHSDQYNNTRFFFYHLAAGTSLAYTSLEQDFIEKVQGYFLGGIEDWPFVTSWGNGTQARYPEGYWWLNYHESVLALTYEDNNSAAAGSFDKTAQALVLGSRDFILGHGGLATRAPSAPNFGLAWDKDGVRVLFDADSRGKYWLFTDLQGHRIKAGSMLPHEKYLSWNILPRHTAGVLLISSAAGPIGSMILPVR